MLKIRLQGTKSDIRWFQNILQQSEELKLTEFSRTFSNRGTSRFFRAYAEVIRKNNEEEEDENGKIIAIANQKGGCTKTNVTVNLGIGLAGQGYKVALVDNDAQGSLTASLGYVEPDDINVTIANIMMNVINDDENEPAYGILHHNEGVDLIPANIELSGLEVSLTNVISRETIMKSYLDTIREQYDYILIDCSLTQNS